ncbi:hypothetical protein [Alicyclobacillus fastidiosus]|uniref:Uncharacterized protein n=1 Tax=Alicyclobacillus fastidiosus TaxID=392011 RepID=A0ABV5ALC8_9BACL|nr:hypothetical protein [Alicyclobacillus fastidiosus]WEH08397.1 hypothetical protein PYS47_17100 [Alicyclobacillus fastidiosus]
MTSAQVKEQIDRLQNEIGQFKAEIYDREKAIQHLQTIHEVLVNEETVVSNLESN